ncbi:hypothetical protein A3C59_00095 [Candidatus Daviesbacteria bacterium RIFCSPHIGHO2_02_FULL_36_13]|uniref:Uncharacterized protein n=1 Tax=Candidatus Daviesbacteria bacterium RIFCSPHIGHO2_02_FULL_36_13 TaxID=1797768 RepID=A0A1F5JY97_9BACT|nr:MAG: hypothetical protein A3C59_00095 [Candidatus Daviesbacteria bacterium RIFCSPHIGHO2_02_FULL_36_13]OGE40874.1 MAG: hypothetical protein A3A45_01300 [Candidatus Daviesbacteria bacterium RIFCSPLOWO2_01_FULL_36_8]
MFFLIILLVSLLVRLYSLDFPLSYIFAWGDGTRDYFVANHIVLFHEYPLLGPFNLLYEAGIYNTPLYYYFLAFFLNIYNSVFTLGVVNVIFQIATIVLIYLIAKKLFDKKTAILSTLIFSFSPEILAQSDYIWQPHLSQAFAYLSLFLAVLFYFNKRFIFLFWSSLILAFSFAMHNSTLPWIPIFFLFFYRHFLKIILPFSLFMALLYLPVIIYLWQIDYSRAPFALFIQNAGQYLANFFINLEGILKAFQINNLWMVVISVLGVVYFIKSKDKKETKLTVLLLLVLFLSPIFSAATFNKFRLHYLALSLGVLTIFLGKIFTFSKYRIVTFVVGSLLLLSTTNNLQFLNFQKNSFENQKLVNDISSSILNEVGNSSFQIKSYAMDEKIFEYPTLDTIFLIPLEAKLNKKLAVLDDNSPFNHVQTGGKDYFIIACHDFSKLSRWSECLEVFKKSYPSYIIIKSLYTGPNLAIYLSKNE